MAGFGPSFSFFPSGSVPPLDWPACSPVPVSPPSPLLFSGVSGVPACASPVPPDEPPVVEPPVDESPVEEPPVVPPESAPVSPVAEEAPDSAPVACGESPPPVGAVVAPVVASVVDDIRRDGRPWMGNGMERYARTPGKIEMVGGKLLTTDGERLTMIALLLENVGVDRVVRLGDPAVWRAAVAELDPEP